MDLVPDDTATGVNFWAQQLAGSADFGAVFEVEQPLLDALWQMPYGDPDPGAPPPPPPATAATPVPQP